MHVSSYGQSYLRAPAGSRQAEGCVRGTVEGVKGMKHGKAIFVTGAARTRFQEVPRYEEGLYDLGNGVYAWMTPNGSWGESNAGLIVGHRSSLLVDTLWDVGLTRRMLTAMAPLTGPAPVTRLVNTHGDGDHFWGNQLLASSEIISSAAAAEEMRDIRPLKMLMFRLLGRFLSLVRLGGADKAGHWFQGMIAPYDFRGVRVALPGRTFSGTLTLDVDGRAVELIEVGPAHTRGDVMVFIPDAKTLFAGDILFIGSTPIMWAGPLDNWLSALDRILAMDADIIIPGHGPATDKEGVRRVRDYWEFLDRHVRTCFQRGLSFPRAARDIVFQTDFSSRPFALWNSPERIMTNTRTLYRHLQGRSSRLELPELVFMLWQQALLAHELPHAQPAVMRMPPQGNAT